MTKLLCISIHDNYQNGRQLVSVTVLPKIAFLANIRINEILNIISTKICKNMKKPSCEIFNKNGYICYCYVKLDITTILVTDEMYPKITAVKLCHKVLTSFVDECSSYCSSSRQCIDNANTENEFTNDEISNLKKFEKTLELLMSQYSEGKDIIDQIKEDMEFSKETLHEIIQKIMDRGEHIENLVDKSDALSRESRSFNKISKQQSRQCPLFFWDITKLFDYVNPFHFLFKT